MKAQTFFNSTAISSKVTDWRTPGRVLELVRQFAPIALDPCTTLDNPTDAPIIYVAPGTALEGPGLENVHVDGLGEPWIDLVLAHDDEGLVYFNPPYGRLIGRWTERGRLNARNGVECLGLLPARPDTRWFQDDCMPWKSYGSDAVCFWRGRLTFEGAPAPAPFPSAIVYWGHRPYRFADVFSSVGSIWI